MLKRKEEGCMELVSLLMKDVSSHVIYKDNTEKCNSNKQLFEVTLYSRNIQKVYSLIHKKHSKVYSLIHKLKIDDTLSKEMSVIRNAI